MSVRTRYPLPFRVLIVPLAGRELGVRSARVIQRIKPRMVIGESLSRTGKAIRPGLGRMVLLLRCVDRNQQFATGDNHP